MKNLPWHVFYLSVIGILGYQLWSKTNTMNLAFEQIEKVLEKNLDFFKSTNQNLYEAVNKNIEHRYVVNGEYKSRVQNLDELKKSKFKFIDKTILDFKQKKSISYEEVENSLAEFPKLLHMLTRDKKDSLALMKSYSFDKLLSDGTIKDVFKNRPILYLHLFKNQMYCDEYVYLNYAFDKTTPIYSGWHQMFKLDIAPKNAAIIEGEKFEADLCLASYSSSPGRGLEIIVNNQSLPIKDGIAHYKKSNQSIGLHKIKAQAKVINPVTGHVTTVNSEFEYQVLPKCSVDCPKY